jgi:hypothetical protein
MLKQLFYGCFSMLIFDSFLHIKKMNYIFAVNYKIMGIGKKTQKGMNRLIKTIKRKRQLKKAAKKSFSKPEGGPQE